MAKVSISEQAREQPAGLAQRHPSGGPFVTISRQYGCHGFSLGLLLLDILTEETPDHAWQIYHKEILSHLATETNLDENSLERQRRTRPSLIVDFLRSFSHERRPSGYEIRHGIAEIIRRLAMEGHAIILGQGGAAATCDLVNGLSVRLEAPEHWRVRQIALREGISETAAKGLVRTKEKERDYLRGMYQQSSHRTLQFHLTYDSSVFSLADIAQHVVQAMRFKGILAR